MRLFDFILKCAFFRTFYIKTFQPKKKCLLYNMENRDKLGKNGFTMKHHKKILNKM